MKPLPFADIKQSLVHPARTTLAAVLALLAAVHRFVEVSVGIAVGVVVTAIWPDAEAGPAEPAAQKAGG